MTPFDSALEFVLRWEGGYVNNPTDIEDRLRRALYEESNKYASLVKGAMGNLREYPCCVSSCKHKAYAKGLCNAHYIRMRKGMDLSLPIRNRKAGVPCIECGAPPNSKGGWFRCDKHFKARRVAILKRALVAQFGGMCAKCQTVFPQAVFDFHHLGMKSADVGDLIANASIADIAKEAAVCVLICANCHRMEHNNDKF